MNFKFSKAHVYFNFIYLLALPLVPQMLFVAPAWGQNSGTPPSATPVPTATPLPLPPPVIGDLNGDGLINAIAFGDSLTRGVGDGSDPGEEVIEASIPGGEAGYPLRVELSLGISVSNFGDPGERLSTAGLTRFAATVPDQSADVVIIGGGTNDGIDGLDTEEFFNSVQTMINIAYATGKQPILITAPPTCCDGPGINSSIDAFNGIFQSLAIINDIPLADIRRAFNNTCRSPNSCFLLNRPEGVHPNSAGYDVAAEVVMATLLGIDIFSPDGPTLLEQALDVGLGTVITRPDPL